MYSVKCTCLSILNCLGKSWKFHVKQEVFCLPYVKTLLWSPYLYPTSCVQSQCTCITLRSFFMLPVALMITTIGAHRHESTAVCVTLSLLFPSAVRPPPLRLRLRLSLLRWHRNTQGAQQGGDLCSSLLWLAVCPELALSYRKTCSSSTPDSAKSPAPLPAAANMKKSHACCFVTTLRCWQVKLSKISCVASSHGLNTGQ